MLNVAAQNRAEHIQCYPMIELGLTFSLKGFSKIIFAQPTYFELRALIAECVSLDTLKGLGKFRGRDEFLHKTDQSKG